MRSKLILILLLAFFNQTYSQNIEKINVPKRIVYNYCDNSLIEKTKLNIKICLSDSTNYLIIDKTLMVGPVLWSRYGANEILKNIENGNVIFHVDDVVLNGKMSQENGDSKLIWNEFRKEIKGNDYILRKANENELEYYWAVISWDIDEPLLILETKNNNYILDFTKDDLKLFWIDEFPKNKSYYNPIENTNYQAVGGFNQYRNGEQVDELDEGEKETMLEKVVLLSSENDFEENSSLEDIQEIIDKTNVIFEKLFKDSTKSGKIMVQFELKKKKNDIQFAVRDDLDLEIMKEFEKEVIKEKYPKSKNKPLKLQLIYKVNSYNDTE